MKNIVLKTCLLFISTLSSCSNETEPVVSNDYQTQDKFHGTWKMTTEVIIYDGETFVEDLKEGNCEYNLFKLSSNGDKEKISHDPLDNCDIEIELGTWSYNSESNLITSIDTKVNKVLIYEVVEITDNKQTLKLISENGELLDQNGFEVYRILIR